MKKRIKGLDFECEDRAYLEAIQAKIGQEVPLSHWYVLGTRAILIAIDGDTATLRYANGALLTLVPLRDLVDDRGFWKS